jgi:primosomal protein N' (replication factor Y)
VAFARVVVDIPTRALRTPFTYAVPPELEAEARVGCCVLVEFGRRPAVGYVVALEDEPPAGLDPAKVQPLRQLLSGSLFGPESGAAVEWIAREYAAPLSEAARLFCPPGFSAKTVRDEASGAWALQQAKVAPADDRWVSLTDEGRSYVPRANARAEAAVLAAVAQGPVRQVELALEVSGVSAVVGRLAKKGVVRVERRRRVRGAGGSALSSAAAPRRAEADLTAGQRSAVAAVRAAREAARGDVVLLDGVTGSGKTEVYLLAIEETLAAGRDACVLVPEISLTPQTVGRFRARFGDRVAVLHSRLGVGERFDQWDMVASGEARVVVGARSALFAPLANPGLYVIDEEHETSYKQSQAPRYHAREVAAYLARAHGAALVLGSATPSLEALGRCERGRWGGVAWTRVAMPERPAARPLPPVEVVDMAEEFASGWRSMFSRPLTVGLEQVVARGEKAVLLLNQRGFAKFLLCRDCGHVPRCEQCSTSLTYHERGPAGPHLTCHTCGREYPVPATCPACGSRYLRQFGCGTQRVEDELRALLPEGFPVVRMDADTTRGKGGHERCLEAFDEAPSAVLLGTQMVAKGLDFPEVTLVGVINADTVLKVCDFRAAERTYALLEQVSGRAGRGDKPGRVVIQTYSAKHPAIRAAAAHDRALFTNAELPQRAEVGYPPYARLANVLVWGPDEAAVAAGARSVGEAACAAAARMGGEVLGPVECVVSRVEGRFRQHVLVRAAPEAPLGPALDEALSAVAVPRGVSVAVDVDPYDLL